MTSDPVPADDNPPPAGRKLLAPLGVPVFRRIWLSSLLSNFGLLIIGVAAAWEMMRLSGDPAMVALVQTAIMSPFMVFALFAGALADIVDRRLVSLLALAFPVSGAIGLTVLSLTGLSSPWAVQGLCFVVGMGLALFSPAWQASVSEQVSPAVLPAAIALNGISFNIARSVGPAIGGVLVAAVGVVATFGASAVLYLPLLLALLLWRRDVEASRLPPEKLGRAIIAGTRFAFHSPQLLKVLLRGFTIALALSSLYALMPLIARDILGGGPQLYGLLLAGFGIGSVIGAIMVSGLRERLGPEWVLRAAMIGIAGSTALVAVNGTAWLTIAVLGVAGAGWMAVATLLNVVVQTSAPRWVTARVLGLFQTIAAAGLAIGSWIWGEVASQTGLVTALLASAVTMIVFFVLGFVYPLSEEDGQPATQAKDRPDPEIALAITGRSGPITLEIEYHVDPARAREFYRMMDQIGRFKRRNGAQAWMLARDLHDPAVWVERYQHATWNDFLRNRNRETESERELQIRIVQMTQDKRISVRRLLDRPAGSVRWNEDAPDPGDAEVHGTTYA